MRVLEVSLRKAGFTVTTAASVQDALDKLEVHAPDLIISETTFPDGDGFELRRRVRATPDWAEIPFIFLTAEAAIENKIRGLELGVDDYLTKPIYIKEIVTRINILLQKRQRVRFEERRDGRTRFAGRVADMPVVDVIQTIEISRKSGVIQFVGDRNRQAAIYFREGRVIDAEAGGLQGEDAVYRLLTWNEGEFEVVFRTVRRREVIQTSSQGLLMEGMRRLDEWSRLLEQLPALSHRFEVDIGELAGRLGDVPDDNNPILRLIDGRRTLLEVIDASDVGDLECLQAISRLYFEELLIDLDHGTPVRHPTGKPVPLVEVEAPTPIEDAASGPIPDQMIPPPPGSSGRFRAPIAPEPAYTDPAPDVISEEIAEHAALMGNYRPSSLRLIDEAVAAAQAIEPSMFEDDEPRAPGRGYAIGDALVPETAGPDGIVDHGANGHASNGVHATLHDASAENVHDSVPHVIEGDDGPSRREPSAPARREPSGPSRREPSGRAMAAVPDPAMDVSTSGSMALGRDDSGLRMIGSLGRDRAEASGELALGAAIQRSETQRELVTIMPRRITREIPQLPVVSTPEKPAEDKRVATDAELEPMTATGQPAAPVEQPVDRGPRRPTTPPLGPPTRRSTTQMSAASGTRISSGPGPGAIALIVLAAILAGIAIYLRVRRTPERVEPSAIVDAGTQAGDARGLSVTPITPVDAAQPIDAGERIAATSIDAAPAAAPIDAAPSTPPDAAPAPPVEDKAKKSREMLERANDALAEGDAAKALDLAGKSADLRQSARAHIVRAQALQRLDRVDEALTATATAERLAGGSWSTVYEVRGRILWAARRKDEARAEFEKFLKLEPKGPRATQIQRMLDESR